MCSVGGQKKERGVLDAVVSARFSPPSKVGALVLRKVIFFFHIYPKSPGVLYGWSLKVGELASRCTLMGISVAEICGIEMTSSDSSSLLSSPRLPAGPRLRPSVWVTPHAQTQRRYSYALPAASSLLTWLLRCCVSTHAGISVWLVEALFKLFTRRLTLSFSEHVRRTCGNDVRRDHAEMSLVARSRLRFLLLVLRSTCPWIGSCDSSYLVSTSSRR